MKKIAVIGTGIMGNGIAVNFLKAGYEVYVWNRDAEKLKSLVALGAKQTLTPKEAAEASEIVLEVTASDESSKAVWTGEEGILAGARKDSVLITCATLSMKWILELVELCERNDLNFFDMPMTGGRSGAENGQLVLLAGGDEKKLEEIKPILSAISQKILYFGPEGSGMKFKLLLNMLQAIHLQGFGEVMRIAKQNNMNLKAVGDALSERPGGTTTVATWRDYQNEPDPINFSIKWITKDLEYAKRFAEDLKLPLLDDVLKQYKDALTAGLGEKDWTSIIK